MLPTNTTLADIWSRESIACNHYSWRTASDWKGTWRQFILLLNDGTMHLAFFQLK